MSDIGWLRRNGFTRVGGWSATVPKLKRHVFPEHPGIYAFVVEKRVFYIGKAERQMLRKRLPRYNRCMRPVNPHKPRPVHEGIIETVAAGGIVGLWVHRHRPDSPETIGHLEAPWLREKSPEWNVNGV